MKKPAELVKLKKLALKQTGNNTAKIRGVYACINECLQSHGLKYVHATLVEAGVDITLGALRMALYRISQESVTPEQKEDAKQAVLKTLAHLAKDVAYLEENTAILTALYSAIEPCFEHASHEEIRMTLVNAGIAISSGSFKTSLYRAKKNALGDLRERSSPAASCYPVITDQDSPDNESSLENLQV